MAAKKGTAKKRAPTRKAGAKPTKKRAGTAKKAARVPKRATPRRAAAKAATAKRAKGRAADASLPKADGDAPVAAYIATLVGWQREVAQRFDDIIGREVPGVRRAVKWSAPFYGVEGQGWFASFAAFQKHVKLNFFRGTMLKPVPPEGTSVQMRAQDIRSLDELDEKLVTSWVRQAAKLPGWGAK